MTADRPGVVQAVRSGSFAGVERYICDVSSELSRRGWRVSVIGGEPVAMRRALPEGVVHVRATTTWQVARALSCLGPSTLVHAHMTAAEAASVLTRPRTRAAVVSTRHFAGTRGRTILTGMAAGVLARGIAKEIAISSFVADAVEGSPEVVLHGVACRDQPPQEGARVILVMQRLEREKDTETAVRAFALSGLAREGWVLRVAGRGSDLDRLQGLARSLDLGTGVEWWGFVDDAEQVRRSASMFLATTASEGFGLSLAEAMATGLAPVAADGGAHREVLADTGLLYPPGDAAACASLLQRLARSPEERHVLGRAARARQRERLSLRTHVDRLVDIYRRVAP